MQALLFLEALSQFRLPELAWDEMPFVQEGVNPFRLKFMGYLLHRGFVRTAVA